MKDADRAVWARYTQGVTPLRGVAALPTPAETAAGTAPTVEAVPATRRRGGTPPALAVGVAPGGLDRATWARFRSGRTAPVRTLDLHGMTVQRAYAALHAFMGQAKAERWRCVEVITGRGSGEGGGAIRRELPHWLNGPALRGMVLAASHPHPANEGAVRLLLRRVR